MSNWISSDFHYGHKNITGPKVSRWSSGYRDFDSVRQMNDAIVSSINDLVKPNDTLWFLGDWAFGDTNGIEFRNKLNVKNIMWVWGNHDYPARDCHLATRYSDIMQPIINDQKFFFSHYAHRIWPKSHRGVMHCYGHSHHSLPDDWGRSMDVGWCKYRRPLNIDEVIDTLSKRPIHVVDHHKET